MNRDGLRRNLAWGLVATLLLPVVLAVVLGLGALLGSLGDTAGAAVCSRAAIAIGVLWLTAIVATTATNAVAMLIGDDRRCRPRGGPRRRRRRRRDGGLYEGLPRERRPLEAEPGDRRG